MANYNEIALVGTLKVKSVNTFKDGRLVGTGMVGNRTVKFEASAKMHDALQAKLTELDGEVVIANGYLKDGTWCTEEGNLRIGNTFMVRKLRLAGDNNAERVVMRLNMKRVGDRLFYEKVCGELPQEFFFNPDHFDNLYDIPEEEVVGVQIRWTIVEDELFGHTVQHFEATRIGKPAVNEHSKCCKWDIESYDVQRSEYLAKLVDRATRK